uniref:Secreted protein n=1 Tax=Steinernema glaseri TaxID=37863 RepID=A0A1I7YY64_9BILA
MNRSGTESMASLVMMWSTVISSVIYGCRAMHLMQKHCNQISLRQTNAVAAHVTTDIDLQQRHPILPAGSIVPGSTVPRIHCHTIYGNFNRGQYARLGKRCKAARQRLHYFPLAPYRF